MTPRRRFSSATWASKRWHWASPGLKSSRRLELAVNGFELFLQFQPAFLKLTVSLAQLAMFAQHAQAFLAPLIGVQIRVGDHLVELGQSFGRQLHLGFHLLQAGFQRLAAYRALLACLGFQAALRAPVDRTRFNGFGLALVAFL